MKVINVDLPIDIGKTIETKIDITEIYDRCLLRSITNKDVLTIEFRLNYSNESSDTNSYYRRNIVELCLNYFSSITFQINDIQNDEEYAKKKQFRIFLFVFFFNSDLSYLMCCTIENHLSEGIIFDNNIIKASEPSLISIKQNKIKLITFPTDLNQLINDIRTQLPTYMYFKTIDSVSIFSF